MIFATLPGILFSAVTYKWKLINWHLVKQRT